MTCPNGLSSAEAPEGLLMFLDRFVIYYIRSNEKYEYVTLYFLQTSLNIKTFILVVRKQVRVNTHNRYKKSYISSEKENV